MANILFVYDRTIATVQALFNSFTSARNKQKGLECKFVLTNEINRKHIDWADAVVMIRSNDIFQEKIVKKAHEAGCLCIQFYDDDFLNLPEEFIKKVERLPWRKGTIIRGLSYTDVVLTPNELIGKKFSQYTNTKRYVVSDTGVEEEVLGENANRYHTSDDEKVRLVFAAGEKHEDSFYKYIEPIIPKLAEKYHDHISFVFFGVHPDLKQYEDIIETEYFPSMDLIKYRETIKNGHYEVGLSPLDTTDFTKCKYYNKFIEYTIAGFPGIYSNTEPFTLIVKDGINGLIADNAPESWYENICRAVDDAPLRRSCYDNAYNQIKRDFNVETLSEKFFEAIPELKDSNEDEKIDKKKDEKKDKNKDKKKCKSFFFTRIWHGSILAVESVYLVFCYLKGQGIKGTIAKCKSFVGETRLAKKEKL